MIPSGSLGSMRLLLASPLQAEFSDSMPVFLYGVYGGFFIFLLNMHRPLDFMYDQHLLVLAL